MGRVPCIMCVMCVPYVPRVRPHGIPRTRVPGTLRVRLLRPRLPPGSARRATRAHGSSPNVSLVTHFVLCTPGFAGTMIRAGYP